MKEHDHQQDCKRHSAAASRSSRKDVIDSSVPAGTIGERDNAKDLSVNGTRARGWWSQRDLNPCLSLERAPS